MKWSSSGMLVAVLLASLPAQLASQDKAFDELYARADAVPTSDQEARKLAFAAAFRAFETIPEKTPGYAAALPRGAWSAYRAQRYRSAARLFSVLRDASRGGDPVVTAMLTSLFRSDGGGRDSVVSAKDGYAKHQRAVHDWLAQPRDFGRLAALGGDLLQRRDPLGLWLLETQEVAMRGRRGREFALANLALAYRQSGDGNKAYDTYGEALKIASHDATLWNDFGLLLKGLGKIGPAFDAFVAGLRAETEPGSSPSGTNLGVLFQRTGKSRGRDPQEDLARVLRKRPDAALTRRLLLDILAGAGSRKSR